MQNATVENHDRTVGSEAGQIKAFQLVAGAMTNSHGQRGGLDGGRRRRRPAAVATCASRRSARRRLGNDFSSSAEDEGPPDVAEDDAGKNSILRQ